MPELPEVETVRQGLAPALEGRTLVRVLQRRANLRIPFPPKFAEQLTGRRVTKLARRAKYLLVHLDNDDVLLVHLGMSGRFAVFARAGQKFGKHDHVVLETDVGAQIVFTDHRRFGLMTLLKGSEVSTHRLLAGLGPEPLTPDFSPSSLLLAFKGKRSPVKSALLDQQIVAGLGNIYVCEALFGAQISPMRLAGSLKAPGLRKLVSEVKAVLRAAIQSGGSTLRDYQQTSGELGYFQNRFRVYGREGEDCVRRGCDGVVRRDVQSGRSTFHCATCQR